MQQNLIRALLVPSAIPATLLGGVERSLHGFGAVQGQSSAELWGSASGSRRRVQLHPG